MGRPQADQTPVYYHDQPQFQPESDPPQPQQYHYEPVTTEAPPDTLDDVTGPPPSETNYDENQQEASYQHTQLSSENDPQSQSQSQQQFRPPPTPSQQPTQYQIAAQPVHYLPQSPQIVVARPVRYPPPPQMVALPQTQPINYRPPPQANPQAFPPQAYPQAFPPDQANPQAYPPDQAKPQAFPPQANYPQAFAPQANYPQAFAPQANYQQAFPPQASYPQAFPHQTASQPPQTVQQLPPCAVVKPNVPLSVNTSTPGNGIPVPNQYPSLPGSQGWRTGLFDCMNDPGNALITACFPCLTFGQIAEIIDNGHTSCATSGLLYGLIAFFIGLPCLMSCTYRSKLRSRYGLVESPAPDWVTHFLCEWCALCQEYRELQLRGFDPSIGWLGNVNKNQNMQQQQFAMVPPMNQTMMG